MVGNLRELIPAFFVGPNGEQLSADEIARRREIAGSLLAQATDTSPTAGGGASVLAKAIQGLSYGINEGRARRASQANAEASRANIAAMLSGSGAAPSASAFPPAPSAGPVAALTGGAPDAATARVEQAHDNGGGGFLPQSFLGALDSTEGAGNYDTLFGHAQRDGGRFAGTRVSQMPISDVLAFADPRGAYGQHVKKQVGRVATPMGRGQIVGTTLRKAVGELGIDPSTPFNADTQHQIMGHLARRRIAGAQTMDGKIANLRSEWKGFKSVPRAQMEQIVRDLEGSPTNAVAAVAPTPAPVVAPQVAQALTSLPVNEVMPMAGGVDNPRPIVPTAPQNPMQGLNPAVVQALSNPNATAQERAIAQALLQQHVAQNQALQEQARKQAEQANMLAQRRGLAGRMGIDPNYAVDDTIWKAASDKVFRDAPSRAAGSYIERPDGTLEQVPEPRTGDIQEYEYARENGYQGSFTDYQQAIRRAGASQTSIDLGGGKKFDEEFAKLDAQALGEVAVSGLSAQRNLGRIDQLETLLAAAPSGTEARFKQMAGEWGIPTEGLSEIQAAQALINSLVPEQRPAGSGPMSDADLELFKQSLPRVINQDGGNATIINTMRAIAQYDAEGSAIVQQLRAGDINRQEAFQMLQSRQNPLANFKAAPEQDGDSSADGWTSLPNGVKIRPKGAN